MKTEEMFPIDSIAMDSPRLAWIKKHQVLTYHLPSTSEWLAGFVAGPNYAKISASTEETSQWFCDQIGECGDGSIGIAATEADAISELMTTWYARSNGIRLWNEESSPNSVSATTRG